jgi:3-oxoacyl-[acyl-carrier protein] reductase
MFNFTDQFCIVTGGTRGIGANISKHFLQYGAKVMAIYANNDQAADAFKQEMSDFSSQLLIEKCDVSDYNHCEQLFNKIDEQGLNLDILVNNSGVRRDQLLPLMKEHDWDQVLDINLKGTFNMSKFAVLRMLKNRYGRIINMSSIGGSLGLPGQSNYSASKAGQIAFAKSVSKEVGKKGITVNCVAPGFIETELVADLPEKQVEEYKKQVPLKRFGKAEEVSHAVCFLASKQASYITGTTLEITGGL